MRRPTLREIPEFVAWSGVIIASLMTLALLVALPVLLAGAYQLDILTWRTAVVWLLALLVYSANSEGSA